MLVTTSKELVEKVNVELKRQMAYLSRKEIMKNLFKIMEEQFLKRLKRSF